ncbi:MAG: methyltransferase [Saprospiraceae bacterium]
MRLTIPPGVFHPGVFFSTPVFISFLQKIDFQNKTVLDVGTGSGMLALFAAQRGGLVTALDINPLAVETARRNAAANQLEVEILESDLFKKVPKQHFDIVLINPPYFAANPRDIAAHAFFAGENLEYFKALFQQLPDFTSPATQAWMILSEKCELGKIGEIAAANGLKLEIVFEKKKWSERLQILQINPSPSLATF